MFTLRVYQENYILSLYADTRTKEISEFYKSLKRNIKRVYPSKKEALDKLIFSSAKNKELIDTIGDTFTKHFKNLYSEKLKLIDTKSNVTYSTDNGVKIRPKSNIGYIRCLEQKKSQVHFDKTSENILVYVPIFKVASLARSIIGVIEVTFSNKVLLPFVNESSLVISLVALLFMVPCFVTLAFTVRKTALLISGQERVFQENLNEISSISKKLEKLDTTGDFPGVYKSVYFSKKMVEEHRRALFYKHPISLIVLSIDNFSSIANKYGQEVAQKCLKRLAATVSKQLRKSDLVARFAENEFQVIMIESTIDESYERSEQIRLAVKNAKPLGKSFTISLGISSGAEHSVAKLTEYARRALHNAQKDGGDKTEKYP